MSQERAEKDKGQMAEASVIEPQEKRGDVPEEVAEIIDQIPEPNENGRIFAIWNDGAGFSPNEHFQENYKRAHIRLP